MKKSTLKKMVPFGILFFGISLLLWNCEKEEFGENIVLEETASNYHSRIITLDDIYDVKKHLDDLMPQSGINKTSEVEGAIFDEDHVLEVIDTLQNTNYSLRFTYPDTPPGEFYNLVIGRTPEGVLKTPFVLKYTCDDNFLEDYIAHDFNMYYFKGMVKRYVYTDFFSVDAFSRTTGSCPPELDAVGDPVACEQAPIDGSDTSGGGGDGGNYGNPNSNPGNDSGGIGGSSSCIMSVGTSGPCAEGGTAIHSAASCGAGTGVYYVVSIYCQMMRQTRTTDDCPACADANTDGGIGVNEPSISSSISNIKNALDLNSSELFWLHNDAATDEIMAIDLYINMNSLDGSLSNEAKEFGEGAVEALVNNGEVDFGEEVILDADLKENDCLYSVYTEMGKAPTFANYLENFDGDMSVANLRLKYDESFANNIDPEYHNALAITLPPQNYLIDIIFNGDENLDASIHDKPKLIIALSFIHEMIHAEIYRKMLSAAQLGNLNSNGWTIQQQIDFVNNLRNDFPGLYDYYYQRWHPNWGHQIMAQHYLDIIVSALSEYDNDQNSPETYEALAWIGLYDTISWNNLSPEQQQNHITNRQNFESNATDICN